MDQLGKLIRENRIKNNLKIENVAKKAKLTVKYLSLLETTKVVPVSERVLLLMSKLYKMPKEPLLELGKIRKVNSTKYRKKLARRKSK